MTTKQLSYDQLKEAVRISFDGDYKILSLYDPNIPVQSLEDVQNDILRKVVGYDKLQYIGVYEKGEIVGYYVRNEGMLVSFALSMPYRVRSFKRKFFDIVKRDFKGMFTCFLWSRNQRAIKYLVKCGMSVQESNNLLTVLKCP